MLVEVEPRNEQRVPHVMEDDMHVHVVLRGPGWEVTVADQVVQSDLSDEAEALHIAEDIAEELGLSVVTHAGGPAA